MLAAVQPDGRVFPCVIYWTGRVRLSVKVTSWCGGTFDASDGVIQIPDSASVCPDCQKWIKIGKPKEAST
jgi:hypothetical protein